MPKEATEEKADSKSLQLGGKVSLNIVPIGTSGVIDQVTGEGRIRRRLFDMGLTPGAEVFLRKKAPLGDPLEITLRGYELTLRKDEAQYVEIKVTDLPDDFDEEDDAEEAAVEEEK